MAEIYGFAINVEGNAVKSITAIDQQLNVLEKNAQKTDSVFGGLFKFEMLKQAFNLIKTGAMEVYNFGKGMEQTMLSFEVMTGSKEKAAGLQKELKGLADISPMVDSAIYGGGKMLLNYGIEANKVGGYLNMLGDISAGDADRFQRLAYVFGQVSAQTKLQGADLRQMIDAGFNPLNTMVQTTGKSYEQLKDDMAKGKISFYMVVGAMKAVTGEGGRFNNMMERQAQTVGGMESTLVGTMQSGMYGMFQRMSPALKDIFSASTKIAQSFADWVTPKQSEILSGQRAEMSAMFEVLKNGNLPLDQRKSLMNQLNTEYKDYLPNIITEKTTTAELAAYQAAANTQLLAKIKITAQRELFEEQFKKAAAAQKVAMEAQILFEKTQAGDTKGWEKFKLALGKAGTGGGGVAMATGGGGALTDLEVAQVQMNKANRDAEEANKDLEKLLKSSQFKGFAGDLTSKGLSATSEAIANDLKAQNDALLKGGKGSNLNRGLGDAFAENAAVTAGLTAGGGLGQAKNITMNFNQPLLQITAGSIDGNDMQDNAEKVVDQLTREIHNIAYEQGVM